MKTQTIFALCMSTFVLSSAYAAQLDAKGAYEKLSIDAQNKVKQARINPESLLINKSNDLIVELSDVSSSFSTGADKRSVIASQKQKFRAKYKQSDGVVILRDYNALGVTTYRINHQDTLIKLLNDPEVKAIYPNRINKAFGDAESLPLIKQPQAAANGFEGAGTSVVIADSGLDYRHADFGNCTAVGVPSTCRVVQSFDTATDDNLLDDSVNSGKHGTNVAGIVASVAPKAKLIGIDVFDGKGAYDSDIIAAINWSINNAKTYNIKAINLSLGYEGVKYTSECTSSAYKTPFANARAAGVVPVVAAGNDGFTDGISNPACTVGAIRVGAVYDSNVGRIAWTTCTDATTAADKVTCFSNGGKLITLFAPGAIITAAGVTQGGTSQASPHVAGAYAVLRSNTVSPQETIDQTTQRLKSTGKLITDQRNGLSSTRLDLLAATAGLTHQ